MRARRFLILMVVTLCPLSAPAQTNALQSTAAVRAGAVPPGITIIPWGYNDRDQWVIPRYADGKRPPAGGFEGYGPGSVMRGTAKTQTLPIKAVCITEGVGDKLSAFQGGTVENYAPAVMRPWLRNLTIAGYDNEGLDYAGTGVYMGSANWAEKPDLYDLARIKGNRAQIVGCNFFYCPGTALWLSTGSGRRHGQGLPFDALKWYVGDCTFGRVYRAMTLNAIDGIVGNIEIAGFRDWGIKVPSGGGSVQFMGAVHTFGGGESWPNGNILEPGVGVWFEAGAGGCEGGPFYVETSTVCMLIDNTGNNLGPIKSFNGAQGCIIVNGSENTLHHVSIPVFTGVSHKVGIQINHQYNAVDGANIAVTPGGKGIVLGGTHGGVGTRLRGIRVSGGDAKSVYIDATQAQHGLANATVEAHFGGSGATGGIGLDLKRANGSSVLRAANTITVTTAGWPDAKGGLATVVDLPDGWQSTTPRKSTNIITINGVRWYPPRDE